MTWNSLLLTALAASVRNESINPHLSIYSSLMLGAFEIYHLAPVSNSALQGRREIPRFATSDRSDLICTCNSIASDYDTITKYSVESRLIEEYLQWIEYDYENAEGNQYDQTRFHGHSTGGRSDVSCILHDTSRQKLWLMSDYVGSMPLWYSIHAPHYDYMERKGSDESHSKDDKGKFIVTTDFISAVRLGFRQITPLGPGQVVLISSSSLEIISVYQRNARNNQADKTTNHNRNNVYTNPDYYATNLLSASLRSLHIHKTVYKSNGTIEVDRNSASSILLQCSLLSLGYSFSSLLTEPLVLEAPDEHYPSELRIILNDPYLQNNRFSEPKSAVWTPSFKRMALDRWKVCTTIKPRGGVLISFDTGLINDNRPMLVYLQNLLCGIMNVKLVYPYNSPQFQQTLHSSTYKDSYTNQAVDILSSLGVCSVSRPAISTRDFSLSPQSSTNSIKQPILTHVKSSNGTKLGRLWLSAIDVANPETRDIVVLLATSGYYDLFANFLCSVSSLNFSHLLILTSDGDIADLAKSMGVGVYFAGVENIILNKFADFGTLLYQELMLFRTQTVMDLLRLGFRVLVSDIDTVWLSNPLHAVRSELNRNSADLVITDDSGEVCGCFVYLDSTERALMFWNTILLGHEEIVSFSHHNNSGLLPLFHLSEQKILTKLLYDNQYNRSLVVAVLPKELFPSGYSFFNLHNLYRGRYGQQLPVIIHNNFMIGKEMKRRRFARYGLWLYWPYTAKYSNSLSTSHSICEHDPMAVWTGVASILHRDSSVPSLTIVLPVHMTAIDRNNTNRFLVQLLMEGFESGDNSKGKLYVENTPPTFIDFDTMAMLELQFVGATTVEPISAIIATSNLQISVDVTLGETVFAIDRLGRFTDAADRTADAYRAVEKAEDITDICDEKLNTNISVALCMNNNTFTDTKEDKYRNEEQSYMKEGRKALDQTYENTTHFIQSFSISVLAYKRPMSLQRLLDSLSRARYLSMEITMRIFIDGAPYNADDDILQLIKSTTKVAKNFNWPHGKLEIVSRESNIGLANQWYEAWNPVIDTELCFIFEDDVEVSPLFFQWASIAAKKYYTRAVKFAHWELFNAVRHNISVQSIEKHSSTNHIEPFLHKYAGVPIPYGICMQRQHVDTNHYPKKLQVKNSNQPFLYSLIGSWGPLMFPVVWQAFKEWWSWRKEKELDPLTGKNLIVDHFYNENPNIWTPWIVRFAYETGMKCLYSNFKGNYSLVTNHREGNGENYAETMGSTSTLISNVNMEASGIQMRSEALPDYSFLAQWQLDFNLRRAGHFGQYGLQLSDGKMSPRCQRYLEAYNKETMTVGIDGAIGNEMKPSKPIPFSCDQMFATIDLLEAYLPPQVSILHFGISSLLLPLLESTKRWNINQYNSELPPGSSTDEDFFAVVYTVQNTFNSILMGAIESISDDMKTFIINASYLIVIADCENSPTDMGIFENEGSYDFSILEEICSEEMGAPGVMIYANIRNLSEDWFQNRHSLTRRLQGQLTSTTYLSKRAIDVFV